MENDICCPGKGVKGWAYPSSQARKVSFKAMRTTLDSLREGVKGGDDDDADRVQSVGSGGTTPYVPCSWGKGRGPFEVVGDAGVQIQGKLPEARDDGIPGGRNVAGGGVLSMVTAVAIFLGLAMVDLLPLLPVSAVVA
ncbi:hypothetical protein Nepgr_017118 [Nepenthes gracilis]|uniref:Uncharacterized protein n=1 Tax=Nepenthes gracilis TaxID=150966 RepID=A0AAD3SQK3_NEPGR|nr:hypothetical protein Nepgr_017118 [Nepenthes gracilis]